MAVTVFLDTSVILVVTDNRRHFVASLRHGIRVDTPAEFLAGLTSR